MTVPNHCVIQTGELPLEFEADENHILGIRLRTQKREVDVAVVRQQIAGPHCTQQGSPTI